MSHLLNPLQSNCVLSWNFLEGTGTSVRDLSSNSYTGTLTSGTWHKLPNSRYCVELTGGDNYISIPDGARMTGDFTVNVWVNPDSLTNKELWGGAFITGYNTPGVGCGWYNSNFYVSITDGVTDPRPQSSFTNVSTMTPIGEWSMITVTYNVSVGEIKIYVNGVEVNYLSQNIIPAFTPAWLTQWFRLGMANQGSSASYDGKLTQFSIYNTVLTYQEVRTLYRDTYLPSIGVAGTPPPTPEAPPEAPGRQVLI